MNQHPWRIAMSEAALAASYGYCRGLARTAARNFYYGFVLLPSPKRDALCALYAFMRGVDDISDSPGDLSTKRQSLSSRRAEMDRVLAGENLDGRMWPAFRHTVQVYGIPARYLHDLISGAEMDLSIASYATFDRLREYCYRVAGTVGLCCIHVFGFSSPLAPELAEKLGIAFQLTNILRDVPADSANGRVYLPIEDLERFGCHIEDLSDAARARAAWRHLAQFEVARAWDLYREALPLVDLVEPDSQAALWSLATIYSGILRKIEARDYDVLTAPPPRLSSAQKIWILARARLGWRGETHDIRNGPGDWRGSGRNVSRRRTG
jgi:15-cis-phytoene synthase